MDLIQDYTNALKDIQSDLVGILITSTITSIISIITLIVNSILQVHLANKQYNSAQYELMRNKYPEIRQWLLSLEIFYLNVENNKLYDENFTIKQYLNFDWQSYRVSLSNDEIESIDSYQKSIVEIINIYRQLNDYFDNNNLPATSKKVQKSIQQLQLYCKYIIISTESNDKKIKEYNYKIVKKTIKIFDKHYNKF